MSEFDPPRGGTRGASAIHQAVNAALGGPLLERLPSAAPAQQGAAPRNSAQPIPAPICRTDPPPASATRHNPKPLKAIQLTAARLLLQGKATTDVAKELGVHRWTVSRWRTDARFQAELRRQVERAALRHAAQQSAAR